MTWTTLSNKSKNVNWIFHCQACSTNCAYWFKMRHIPCRPFTNTRSWDQSYLSLFLLATFWVFEHLLPSFAIVFSPKVYIKRFSNNEVFVLFLLQLIPRQVCIFFMSSLMPQPTNRLKTLDGRDPTRNRVRSYTVLIHHSDDCPLMFRTRLPCVFVLFTWGVTQTQVNP